MAMTVKNAGRFCNRVTLLTNQLLGSRLSLFATLLMELGVGGQNRSGFLYPIWQTVEKIPL